MTTGLDTIERQFLDIFRASLEVQKQTVIERLESDIGQVLVGFGERADVSSIITLGELNLIMQDLAHIVQKAFDEGVVDAFDDGIAVSVYSGVAAALIAEIMFVVHNFNRTTLLYIGDVFRNVLIDDEYGSQNRRDAVMVGVEGVFATAEDRVDRAAAAGVYGAYNAGVEAAAQEASLFYRGKLRKKWIALDDGRTRLTHTVLDNKVVDLNQPFLSGGWPLQFPGDPRGEPSEVINCRCKLRIVKE